MVTTLKQKIVKFKNGWQLIISASTKYKLVWVFLFKKGKVKNILKVILDKRFRCFKIA